MTEEDKIVLELIKGLLNGESIPQIEHIEHIDQLNTDLLFNQPSSDDKYLLLETKITDLLVKLENLSDEVKQKSSDNDLIVKVAQLESKLDEQRIFLKNYLAETQKNQEFFLTDHQTLTQQSTKLEVQAEQLVVLKTQLEELINNQQPSSVDESDWLEYKKQIDELNIKFSVNEKYLKFVFKSIQRINAKEDISYDAVIQELKGLIEKLEIRINTSEQTLQELYSFNRTQPEVVNNHIHNLNTTVVKLQAQVDSFATNFGQLTEQYQQLSQQTETIKQLSSTQTVVDEKLLNLNHRINSVENQWISDQQKYDEVQQKVEILHLQNNKLENYEQKISNLESITGGLKSQIDKQNFSTDIAELKQRQLAVEHSNQQILENLKTIEKEIVGNVNEQINNWAEKIVADAHQQIKNITQSFEQAIQPVLGLPQQLLIQQEQMLNRVITLQNQIDNIQQTQLKAAESSSSEDTSKELMPTLPITFTGLQQYNYYQELQQVLFKDEKYLQNYFPKSFFINHKTTESAHNFYWLKEKIGLTYLGLVSCKTSQSSFLPTLLQLLINNIIYESKLLDLEIFFQELHKRFQQIIANSQSNAIQCGTVVIDRMSSTVYFLGFGVSLWNGQKSAKKIESSDDFFEKANFKNTKIKKHTLPITRDSRFYLTVDSLGLDKELESVLQNLSNESFLQQKKILEEFLQNHHIENTALVGFGI